MLLIQPDVPGAAAITKGPDSLTLRVAALLTLRAPLGRPAVLVADVVYPTGVGGNPTLESPVSRLPANGKAERKVLVVHVQSPSGKFHLKD